MWKTWVFAAVVVIVVCLGLILFTNAINQHSNSEAAAEATKFHATLFAPPTDTIIPTLTPTPINVSFEDACSYAGKRVSVHGKFGLSLISTFCYGDQCGIELDPAYESELSSLHILIDIGKENNQMEPLPDPYSIDDLKIHTDDGRIVGAGEEVIVSGLVGELNDCTIWMDTVTVP